MESYIQYVQETVEKFKKYANAIDHERGAVTPSLIMQFMANFGNVVIMLNAEYQRKKIDYAHEKIDFDQWFRERLIETKAVLTKDAPKSFKIAVSEIEAQVMVDNREEYLDRKKRLTTKEHEVSFLKSLLDQWQMVGQMYQAMANNMRQEMKTFLFEKSVEKSYTGLAHDYQSDVPVTRRKVVAENE